ncbi:MAG: DUF4037 domain-containing protein [Anaerolineae bacterium]|nr:DUF4037 domain-containing protein [Anaerolineae bacterium]
MMQATFIPGAELSRRYYEEVVRPILDDVFPGLRHDATLIDSGSEVLGFDTPISRDHGWGLRLRLFVSEEDYARAAESIVETLRQRLPLEFLGWPTSYVKGDDGSWMADARANGPVDHLVRVTTSARMLRADLNYEWQPGAVIAAGDWLTFPQQKLRAITHGPVYHEGLGDAGAMRTAFRYYPRDVWLYLLAAGWTRIGQEEAFVGRAGQVGDELGSRLIAARLVRDLMMLCFLIERVYAPYAKWFGSGFARLGCAAALMPLFERVLAASDWHGRQEALAEAYAFVAEMHNALGVTPPLPAQASQFHSRPFLVIHGERFAEALLKVIRDPAVSQIAEHTLIGSVDQFSDSTDLREQAALRPALRALFDVGAG